MFFRDYNYSRTVACCGHVTSNQNVLIDNTHQKSKRQTLFFYSGRQNNWQTIIGQKFHRGQKFRLTPEQESKMVTFYFQQ